jgi:hypothetical protein
LGVGKKKKKNKRGAYQVRIYISKALNPPEGKKTMDATCANSWRRKSSFQDEKHV